MTKTLVFQDALRALQKRNSNDDDAHLSELFFELANVNQVAYRVTPRKQSTSSKALLIQQDTSACQSHTGGIVWETSYLLANFLLYQKQKLGKVLEVGAGCGLLGQVLSLSGYCSKKHPVVLTECQPVLKNLEHNVQRNQKLFSDAKHPPPTAHELDWTKLDQLEVAGDEHHLKPHSFDTIVGTDVLFSTSLVEPLLRTLKKMTNSKSTVWLCLQIRCQDSHNLFLEKAPEFGFILENVRDSLNEIPDCRWGLAMDCHLLKLTQQQGAAKRKSDSEKRNKKKKKKRS